MARTNLRVYRGPENVDTLAAATTGARKSCVTLPAGEVLPLLADAVANQRTWLRDFADDEITISADLYEVLMAYQYFRRPVA
jgi:hypothetical protein